MRKISIILLALVTIFAIVGCASKPAAPAGGVNPPAPTVKAYPPQILEHKG
ncbi:MAG: hypothetical protein JNG85_09740, partial [Spirochaetaceae bacterium]|nr:hypothetical protein [Spirochaetaceae bacterium]